MPLKEEKPFADYIGYDLGGYMYNKKYPPNPVSNGGHHHGYATDNQEAFLYDVAVNLYGVKFIYKGQHYWIPSDEDGWILINEDTNIRSDVYTNPIELMENVDIDGMHLIDVIDECEDIVML